MTEVVPIKMEFLDLDIEDEEEDEFAQEGDGKSKGFRLPILPLVGGLAVLAVVLFLAARYIPSLAGPQFAPPAPGSDAMAGKDGTARGESGVIYDGKNAAESGLILEDIDKEHSKKPKKSKPGPPPKPIGKIVNYEYASFLVLEPITITLKPNNVANHLKVTLVFETDQENAEYMLSYGYYMLDELIMVLRAADIETLRGPEASIWMSAEIRRSLSEIFPDAHISNILISEYVLG